MEPGLLRQFDCAGGIFRVVVGNEGCVLAQREMEHELDDLVRQDLARLASIRKDQVPSMVVEFVVRAFMGILASWLENPDDLSPEEVDEAFRVLTLPGAAAALGVSVELAPAPALVKRIAMARTVRPS